MTVTYPWPTDGDAGDLTVLPHEHTESDITDLGDYATASHSHLEADITDLDDYLTDAPSDGSEYVRKDGAWAVATGGGGGGAVDSVNSQTGDVVLDADDIDDTATLHRFASAAQLSKLDGVEAGATADQTGAEIKAAYEGEANTNAYTDAEKSKLAGIAAGAEVNTVDSVNTQTGAVVLDADDIDDTSTTHKFATAAQLSKIDSVETGADVTDAANVTAAGALMDSEVTNLAAVKAFDPTDYATAAQGTTADSAVQPGDDADTLGSGAATDGQVLTADGLGGAAWEDVVGGGTGISNLSEDTTPQLGGTLDVNGHAIEDASDGTVTVNDNLAVVGNLVTNSIFPSGTVDGRDVAADGTKLDGIEAGADVTDTANVTAAGALMDSEVTNLAQVKAFSSADYATAAQGALADSALQAAHHGATSTDHDDRYYTETEIDSQLQAVEGGETRVNTVAASGATETLPAEYSAHKVTMDQDCTFTFPTPTEDGAAFALYLSGAYTPTFPASVDWDSASAPTYSSPSLYAFMTFDGGTSWVGSLVGSGIG